MNSLYEIDKKILLFFNNTIHSEYLNGFFVFFSDMKSIFVFVPVILITGYILKKRNTNENTFKKFVIVIILSVITIALSDIISARIIKPIFSRTRPCQVIDGLYFWKEKAHIWVMTDGITSFKSSYSFVSSHSSNAMSAAVVLSIFYKKLTVIFVLIALIIGISRLYLGVHYPGDVLSGWAIGAVLGYLIYKTFRKLTVKYPKLLF